LFSIRAFIKPSQNMAGLGFAFTSVVVNDDCTAQLHLAAKSCRGEVAPINPSAQNGTALHIRAKKNLAS
jgi:hypothetical protein